MTLYSRSVICHLSSAICLLLSSLAGCRSEARTEPAPTAYAWPDTFAFVVEYVSETRTDSAVVARYEEKKVVRFAARDEQFLVWHDSVIKETLLPGRPVAVEPYVAEDTLHYYATLDRRGQVTNSEPGCDPAVPTCRDALPSALPLELRRLIPRLPVWAAPRGKTWEDTIVFDDTPRPRGSRGLVVTTYRVSGDTIISGTPMWVIAWRAMRRSFAGVGGAGGISGNVPIEETGLVYVDRDRQIPVFATWAGGVAAPPEMRAMGIRGTGFRGRAYLAGSVVERLLSAPPQ
jgi:hypothetical protein